MPIWIIGNMERAVEIKVSVACFMIVLLFKQSCLDLGVYLGFMPAKTGL